MYPAYIVEPMKAELTAAGFEDLTDAQMVTDALTNTEGTVFLVINSVCGCAAANARPGAKLAVHYAEKKPTKLATVFAGFDQAAVAQARQLTFPYPPSSPSMGLFKNGKLVYFMERHQIEGVSAQAIAKELLAAFEAHC
ncbi:MAG: BrxA/BrxB family bacilliredoxin [Sphingobacteriales bacterium]|jgi:putative YphP/YqiW family bacilliredoxin|nr:BrxA/BrxB family bacilliredoxin [Sphingobacteriales bacterium]MCC7224442.1 BrxA/BrxB family bacilliredoxin [Chitinophagales bacterium]